jgi:hypothetical protein
MGHIVYVAPGEDQGPLLNRVSMAMYTIAIVFVALRSVNDAGSIVGYRLMAIIQLHHTGMHCPEIRPRRPLHRIRRGARRRANNHYHTTSRERAGTA